MEYISTREAAEKWGISQRRVNRLASEGRIAGAQLFGISWMIPRDAQKPADGRTKSGKESAKEATPFRLPLFVNHDEDYYNPPLTPEEKQLRNAQVAFYDCRYAEAKELLLPLSNRNDCIYIQIAALVSLCYITIFDNSPAFASFAKRLNTLLQKDFPHKKEMELLRYGFIADFGFYAPILENFQYDPEYDYDPSAIGLLSVISFIPFENGDFSVLSKMRYDSYELTAYQLERDGLFLEAEAMHCLLLTVYQLFDNKKALFHAQKILKIAMEHHLLFEPIMMALFYPTIIGQALESYPKEFVDLIQTFSQQVGEKISTFASDHGSQTYMSVLTNKELEYTYLINQGFSNRKIAELLGVSEKTVSRKYSDVFEKLGIKSKRELIKIINSTHGKMKPGKEFGF